MKVSEALPGFWMRRLPGEVARWYDMVGWRVFAESSRWGSVSSIY